MIDGWICCQVGLDEVGEGGSLQADSLAWQQEQHPLSKSQEMSQLAKQASEVPAHVAMPAHAAKLLLPWTPFCPSPSLFQVWIQDGT